MKVFNHHIYEYRKGLRNLILHTTAKSNLDVIKEKLIRMEIDYEIYEISYQSINVFFGDKDCIEIIRKINKRFLNQYTPEEDFILGTMLGYCRKQQCERYLKMKNRECLRLEEVKLIS